MGVSGQLRIQTANRRPAVNLSLSRRAIRQGRRLQREMNRPSLSNVVEFLILQKEKDRKAVNNGKAVAA